MSTITQVAVSFRCVCAARVDVPSAVGSIALGSFAVRSNAGRTEHEGKVTILAGSADEATTAFRAAAEEWAANSGTSCEVTIFGAHPVAATI